VIDSTGEKNRTVATFVSNRSKRFSEDTDKERFSHHEDYHREDLHGAVASGTRLIYLLSNVPTSPSTLFTSLPATNVQDTKGGFHVRSQDQWDSLVGERFTAVLPSRRRGHCENTFIRATIHPSALSSFLSPSSKDRVRNRREKMQIEEKDIAVPCGPKEKNRVKRQYFSRRWSESKMEISFDIQT